MQVTDFKHGSMWPVMLISYETLRRHVESLAGFCDVLICDEGHRQGFLLIASRACNMFGNSSKALLTSCLLIPAHTIKQHDAQSTVNAYVPTASFSSSIRFSRILCTAAVLQYGTTLVLKVPVPSMPISSAKSS